MKDVNYIVRIPEPCHEDWAKMQPEALGKFCGSCSKVVFDFSNKTDTEIRDILMSYKDQKVCGHFKKTQIDRPLNLTVDLHRLPGNVSSTKVFAMAIFLVFGTFLFSCDDHHGKKIGKIDVQTNVHHYVSDDTTALGIKGELGTIVNSVTGEPDVEDSCVPGIISYSRESHVAGGLSFEGFTNGEALVPATDSAVIQLDTLIEVRTMGLTEVERLEVSDTTEKVLTVLESLTVTATKEAEDGVKVDELSPDLFVYPNPSGGDFTIKYEVVKRTNVRIDLFDVQGAWLRTIVNINNQHIGKYQLPVNLTEFVNGVYLVNMVSEGKQITKRLVIEK